MNNNKKLGLRRGLWGHSFNLPYSLELSVEFLEKTCFLWFSLIFLIPDTWYLVSDTWYLDIRTSGHLDIWMSGYLDVWILVTIPTPDFCVVHSWQGPFFSRNNTALKFWTSFTCRWFHIFWNQKRRGISPEVGSTKFQPVMFDIDLFGGKKVPRHIKRRTALDFGSHVP